MPRLVLITLLVIAGCTTTRSTVQPLLGDPVPPPAASMNGKYQTLVSTFTVPDDVARYGPFNDYGFWPGGTYKGVTGIPAGFWVYVEPTWYIWEKRVQPEPLPGSGDTGAPEQPQPRDAAP